MAMNPSDLSRARKEALEKLAKDKKEDIQRKINERLEDFHTLENAIDTLIALRYKQKIKGWFSKRIVTVVKFTTKDLQKNKQEALWRIVNAGIYDHFIERYEQQGWMVLCKQDIFATCNVFIFKQIVPLTNALPAIEKTKQIADNGVKVLSAKQNELQKLRARVAELEAEIQFLTESPNSRDPKLLPQKANG